LPRELDRVVFLTVHPEEVTPPALDSVNTLIAVGNEPDDTIARFCRAVGDSSPAKLPPSSKNATPEAGAVVVWQRRQKTAPFRVHVRPTRAEHRRHTRKYAEGELPPERCFYFRGAQGKLKLRVQNLILFNQIAEGIDDATWLHHLKNCDYSKWFRAGIKDDELADETAKIEKAANASAKTTRRQIKELIERYYTLPASSSKSSQTDAKKAK
jgi:hypothetical protein